MLEDDESKPKPKDESQEEELPFACFICRKSFENPVVTKCGHYFCKKCALARYAKDTRCAACNKQTHGLFNSAAKLEAKLEERQARVQQQTDDDVDVHALLFVSDDGVGSSTTKAATAATSGGGAWKTVS